MNEFNMCIQHACDVGIIAPQIEILSEANKKLA